MVVDYWAKFDSSTGVNAANVTSAFKSGLTGSSNSDLANYTVDRDTVVHEGTDRSDVIVCHLVLF